MLIRYGNCITELVTEIPRCFSSSIQSEVAWREALRARTSPAICIAPPNHNSFSVFRAETRYFLTRDRGLGSNPELYGRYNTRAPTGYHLDTRTMANSITITDIRSAAKRLDGNLICSPCLPSRTLSEIAGCEVFLKFENHQFTASFKERGALNKMMQLSGEQRQRL